MLPYCVKLNVTILTVLSEHFVDNIHDIDISTNYFNFP